LLIIGFRSVNGTGIRRIGLFNADLAALSAFSLQGATYIRQGGHHVGHWPTFLVFNEIAQTTTLEMGLW